MGRIGDRDVDYSKIRNRGGNVPIVLESNQNHAIAAETEVCPTLPASMGGGGGYIPMIVVEDERGSESVRSHDKGER